MRHLRSFLFTLILLIPLFAVPSVTVTVNGTNHTIPQTNERGWGDNVTAWIQAISLNTLQPIGGNFTLTGDVNFGATYGLKAAYFKTRDANPASAGLLRLSNTDTIKWRNASNSSDLTLAVNASNDLTFGGTKALLSGAIVNADVASNAAIAFSKINSAGQITSSDVSASAGIQYSKLASMATGQILVGNAGVASATTLTGDATIGATGVLTLANSGVTSGTYAVVQTNAKGLVTSGAASLDLTTRVSGALPIANGGTNNASLAVTAGGVPYTDGSKLVNVGAGTSGQVLTSAGASAPTWASLTTQGKNRIQNGAMAVDQRNEGATVATIVDGTVYTDRWKASKSHGGVTSIARATDSLPVGFSYATKMIATTADAAVAAGDVLALKQTIEGSNVVDFAFGGASASSVTLSFWVRSSKTGTYCVSLINSANNRSYVAEYTISSANTWEQKTVTIAGDTSGTWLTTEGTVGVQAYFTVMAGSTYQQTAGSWGTSGNALGSSNQVNWMDTINATFYLTGVQLEKGSTATTFEQEDINTTYNKVQRFFQKSWDRGTAIGTGTGLSAITGFGGTAASTTDKMGNFKFVVPMYAAPTITIYASQTGTSGKVSHASTGSDDGSSAAAGDIGTKGFRYVSGTAFTAGAGGMFHFKAETGF